jgi:hypothetical protein
MTDGWVPGKTITVSSAIPDFYTGLAEKYGLPRELVKRLTFIFMYGAHRKTKEEIEALVCPVLKTYQELMKRIPKHADND